MFNIFNKTDSQVKQDVLNELLWDPSITSTHIKVLSKDGIVTLNGTVPHFVEKLAAEQAARRVGGVKAVADEIEVKGIFDKSDEDIARAALNALKWNYSVPDDIKVTVSKGWVTLDGEADWDYQRNAAKKAIAALIGIRGVTNNIKIKSKVLPSDIKIRIEEALKRSAEAESRQISVSVKDDKVILTGKVHSFAEIEDAKMAAWNAPGVMYVENHIQISQ
ncbi:BON domain-containing protein [bacterium]|nr:BON domain-containing protein [bacterium]